MHNLRVHRYENPQWPRCHLPWMYKFDKYLSQWFNVEIINYNTDGKTYRGPISLSSQIPNKPVVGISDVDYVLENLDTNEFIVITFSKFFTHHVVHFLKSEKCKGILCAHFNHKFMHSYLRDNKLVSKIDKVKPWIFPFFKEFDVDFYRDQRSSAQVLNDGLFFKGSGTGDGEKNYRAVPYYLQEKKYLDLASVNFDKYIEMLNLQKIAISYYVDINKFGPYINPGELCYRDMEMMSLGVPYIRIEYQSQLHNAFIPDFHYISIPREEAWLAFNTGGNRSVADLFIDKYEALKNDKDFLEYISNNQKNWYDMYAIWPKSAMLAFDLLELSSWQ